MRRFPLHLPLSYFRHSSWRVGRGDHPTTSAQPRESQHTELNICDSEPRTSMNSISAILRIVCGLALIIFSYSTHRRIGERVAAGEPVQIVGVTLGASAGQLTFAFVV